MASDESIQLIGDIFNWTVAQRNRINAAMATNAQWEIWLQVEMTIFLQTQCTRVIREQRYDDSLKSLDVLARVNNRAFAIELKTESLLTGKTSGKSMVQSLLADKEKLLAHPLSKAVQAMGCTELSSIVIGIGDSSKYNLVAPQVVIPPMRRSARLAVNTTNRFAVNISQGFGVYVFLMET